MNAATTTTTNTAPSIGYNGTQDTNISIITPGNSYTPPAGIFNDDSSLPTGTTIATTDSTITEPQNPRAGTGMRNTMRDDDEYTQQKQDSEGLLLRAEEREEKDVREAIARQHDHEGEDEGERKSLLGRATEKVTHVFGMTAT